MKFLLIIAGLIFLNGFAFAQGKGELSFENHLVQETYRGKPVSANPVGGRAAQFRTRIKLGAKEGPNFAGRYTIVTWGCGVECKGIAFVDAATGQVFIAPELLEIQGRPSQDSPTLQYRLNSSLLIVEGDRVSSDKPMGPPTAGKWYYKWEDNCLKLIRGFKR